MYDLCVSFEVITISEDVYKKHIEKKDRANKEKADDKALFIANLTK